MAGYRITDVQLQYLAYWLRPRPPILNVYLKSLQIKFRRRLYNSYVLNSGVTEQNLTKFLKGVQKWLPITLLKSQLRSSNPFRNANVTNEDRRQSAGESRQKLRVSVNSEITARKFTKFGHYVAWLLTLNLLKANLWSANPLSNSKAKSKDHSTRGLRTFHIFNWLP